MRTLERASIENALKGAQAAGMKNKEILRLVIAFLEDGLVEDKPTRKAPTFGG